MEKNSNEGYANIKMFDEDYTKKEIKYSNSSSRVILTNISSYKMASIGSLLEVESFVSEDSNSSI